MGIALACRVDARGLCRREQRDLGGIAVRRTSVACRDRVVAEHGGQVKLSVLAGGGPDAHHAEPILGQRAGLVGGHDGRAPERLHRREVPDDRLPTSHPLNADGERDRDDRRQPLGHGGDGQADAGEGSVREGEASHRGRQAEQDGGDPDRERDRASDAIELAGQRRLQHVDLLEQRGDAPELGRGARGDGDSLPRAGRDQRAGVQEALSLRQRCRGRHRFRPLVARVSTRR